jgi:thymidylate synthase (FAD)
VELTPIAHTKFVNELASDATSGAWKPHDDAEDDFEAGSQLSEFAGRACYQSFDRPNPKTATLEGYLGNIINQGHFSVLEHGTVSFYFTGVSRAFTHELIRHRHFSYSQLSQRFVKLDQETEPVFPPAYKDNVQAQAVVFRLFQQAVKAYQELLLIGVWGEGSENLNKKEIREAARAVLPNCTPTELVVTGNHQAWRHFLKMRGTLAADAEMRMVALEVFRTLSEMEPGIYQDFSEAEYEGRTYLVCNEPSNGED